MKFVLDASFAVAWVASEREDSPAIREFSDRLATGTAQPQAPELFVAETANALWKTVRRGLRTLEDGVEMFGNVMEAPIELHRHRDLATAALDLALRRGITVYDAFYVALALREVLPLFTADRRLAGAVEDLLEVITA
ncbi:MAG: type II toxin-antitoxin system VapC family toxin [Myxococcales bacterium]